jgi:hypothetical protein
MALERSRVIRGPHGMVVKRERVIRGEH